MNIKTMPLILTSILLIITSLFLPCPGEAEVYNASIPVLGFMYEWDGSLNQALVKEILPSSNAEKCGLQPGDKLVVRGTAPLSSTEFVKILQDQIPGETVRLIVNRGGSLMEIQCVVGVTPFQTYFNPALSKTTLQYDGTTAKTLDYDLDTRISRWYHVFSRLTTMIGNMGDDNAKFEEAYNCTLETFYKLYDFAIRDKDTFSKDVYTILNYRYFEFLHNLLSGLERDLENNEPKQYDDTLLKYITLVLENYYFPNYPDIPNMEAAKLSLKKANDQFAAISGADIQSIKSKYAKVRHGWRYLKWGMDLSEVTTLIKTHENYKIKKSEGYHFIKLLGDDSMETDLVEQFNDHSGVLYFYEGKLIGKLVGFNMKEYVNNDDEIVTELKKRYPEGRVIDRIGVGFDSNNYKHFVYESDEMLVFTFLVAEGWSGGGIYYYDHSAISKIKETINNVDMERKLKESEKVRSKI